MIGVNAETGKLLGGVEHLRQSIHNIFSTPINSRVMLREYGSNVPDLIDLPMNETTFATLYAAVADALDKWEPRLKLLEVKVLSVSSDGSLEMYLYGSYLGEYVDLTVELFR